MMKQNSNQENENKCKKKKKAGRLEERNHGKRERKQTKMKVCARGRFSTWRNRIATKKRKKRLKKERREGWKKGIRKEKENKIK